jgi:hypothetical protein
MDIIHAMALRRLAHPLLIPGVVTVDDPTALLQWPGRVEPGEKGAFGPGSQRRDIGLGEGGGVALAAEFGGEGAGDDSRLRPLEAGLLPEMHSNNSYFAAIDRIGIGPG